MKPIQPLKSAGPLFKSGSGDHTCPALLKFDDLNLAENSYEFKPEEASDKPRVSLKAVLEEVRRQEFIEIT